jgi:hypothetical protein
MTKYEKLRKELFDIHQNFLNRDCTLESVGIELLDYTKYIKNFYLEEGKNLLNVLNDVKDSDIKIESVDLVKVNEIYSEYIGGMMSFINEIVSANVVSESEEITSLQEKFNRAKENDSQFIESLSSKYAGKDNYLMVEACSNIAYMVDFIPEMKILLTYCENTENKVRGREDQLSKDSLSMIYESVSHYCNYILNEAINVYESIENTYNGKPEETSKEEFKLF